MSTIRSKTDTTSRVKLLLTGTKKHFPNASQELSFGGATRTVTALTGLLKSYVDLREAVIASQAATKTKVATERAQTPSLLALIRGYVAYVKVTFGAQADALADFGLAPPKARTPTTAEQKAVAVAKRQATRSARHTMGKNQKKDVKGAVQATLVVTPDSGSTSSGVHAPSASGSSPSAGTPPRTT